MPTKSIPTKPVPTTPANLARINKMYSDLASFITHLYSRFLDEGAYEDLATYQAALQNKMPKGFKVTCMTKRPFGFRFTIGTDALYAVTVTGKSYQWTRVA